MAGGGGASKGSSTDDECGVGGGGGRCLNCSRIFRAAGGVININGINSGNNTNLH